MKFLTVLVALVLVACLQAADPVPAASPYPLTTCVVSGDKLGAMNSPVVINYQGTEVRFCCQDCVGSFKANPAKYLAKLKSSTQK